jgi:hypothetical protein
VEKPEQIQWLEPEFPLLEFPLESMLLPLRLPHR